MILTYRLWMRPEKRPQVGHFRRSAADRAETTSIPSSSAALSTTNPDGIRDDKRMMFAMALIPFVKQRQSAMRNHQI
jgi:hypothetical protein